MTDFGLLVSLLACFLLGIAAVQRTGKDLGVSDHGSIVWDEIVPFWLVLFFCPSAWPWQAVAFLSFRVFDIVKPPPARFFDERVRNGFGVMADDLIAALYTLLTLAALRHFMTGFGT
jgi:phosphatidylglycerophosphatase A